MSEQIRIDVIDIFGKDSVLDWSSELSEAGIKVEVSEYQNHTYMALEWLIPTGVVLFMAKPYFETILKEAAKDHYKIIKNVISQKVYQKHFGKSGQKLIEIRAGKQKTSGFFSRTFSISTSLKANGKEIELKLLIPEGTTAENIENSFSSFAEYIHHQNEEALINALIEKDNGREWTKVFWFNYETNQIELIDVVESSRNKKVISSHVTQET